MPVVLILLTVVYAGLAVFAWRNSRNRNGAYPLKTELAVLAPALLVHAAVLLLPVLHDKILIVGFGYTMSVLVWLMLTLYWAGSFSRSLRGLQLLLYPCAVLGMTAAAVFPGTMTGYAVNSVALMLHIAMSLLAYGLFALAALLAAWILLLHRQLRRRRFSSFTAALPPLLSMEKLMFQGMYAGFALLTAAILSGAVYSGTAFNPLTHKNLFSLISWLIYGALLLKHSLTSWRGRHAARWTLYGFFSLFAAYSGSKFVLDILLHR